MTTSGLRSCCSLFLMVGVAGLAGGCATQRVTMQEAALIVRDALTHCGYAKNELAMDSTFAVSTDRFLFRSRRYELVQEIVNAADGSKKTEVKRGKMIEEKMIDIPWTALTKVFIKKQYRAGYVEEVGQYVVFLFEQRDQHGRILEDSFSIGEIRPDADRSRDFAYDVALSLKTLAGFVLPASYASYDYYYRDSRQRWATPPPISSDTPSAFDKTAPSPDKDKELRDLKDLHDRGLVTDEVYKNKQLEILNRK